MTCSFAHDDAAYVLGALSPADRLAFEHHLDGCEDCARSVRELAGLPGLLGRVDASLVEHPPTDAPLPDSLLPALTQAVRRRGRRRTLTAAGAAAAVAAAVATAVVLPLATSSRDEQDGAGPASPGASASPSAPAVEMDPIGEVPVRASVTLEEVTWGTRVGLLCTYDPELVSYELPPEVDYLLIVRTRDGRTERVGSWRSLGGKTMRLTAGTAADPEEIASVQVRTIDGRVVLELAA